ncbi:MAG: prephenate dehydrogenase, partial [Acidobacteriota bacterium]
MERSKLTLIGCGLIGGSMCLALKRRRPDWSVTCLDLPERLPAIREAGVADETAPIEELAAHLPASSLVILAAPVDAILLLLEQ